MLIGENYPTLMPTTAFGYLRSSACPATTVRRIVAGCSEHALAAWSRCVRQPEARGRVRRSRILAGNSFVTAHNVKYTARHLRGHQHRHGATALQVCHNYEFRLSVCVACLICAARRPGTSTLSVDVVTTRSARYALQLAAGLWTQRGWRRWICL